MNKNKITLLTIALIIVFAFSCLLFFGTGSYPKTGIQISSFIFILLDELVTYGIVFYLFQYNPDTFSTAGLASITFIYVAFSLAVNILFKSLFSTVKSILIWNFSILLIFIFIVFIVLLFKKEK